MTTWPTTDDAEFAERAARYLQLHGYDAREALQVARRELSTLG